MHTLAYCIDHWSWSLIIIIGCASYLLLPQHQQPKASFMALSRVDRHRNPRAGNHRWGDKNLFVIPYTHVAILYKIYYKIYTSKCLSTFCSIFETANCLNYAVRIIRFLRRRRPRVALRSCRSWITIKQVCRTVEKEDGVPTLGTVSLAAIDRI